MNPNQGSIRLFRAFDVEILLDYSWFIFFALVVWTFATFYFPRELMTDSAVVIWSLSVIGALLVFVSVTIHELSHALTANRMGFPIRRITLFIFGGVAHMKGEPKEPKTEMAVAAAGPAASFLLWAIFGSIASVLFSVRLHALGVLLGIVSSINLVLAIFNLVPGFPLDGGRILRAAIWWTSDSFKTATNIAAKGGALFAYLLMGWGVISIFRLPSGWIDGIWYILIGIFVKSGADQSYKHVQMEEVLEGIRVADVMGHFVLAVPADERVDTLVEKTFMTHKFTAYPVTDAESVVVGVVDIEQVREIPRERRRNTRVAEVMQPLEPRQIPSPADSTMNVLREMISLGISRLPVVDDEGRLIGMVTRRDILDMFQIRSDLAEEVVL